MKQLEGKASAADLWNNAEEAQKILTERTALQNSINTIVELVKKESDLYEMIVLSEEESEETLLQEAESQYIALQELFRTKRLEGLLCAEADKFDAFVEIHSGAGGTEAQDWAQMLQRLYMHWAEKRSFKVDLIDEATGDEAGIKACTLKIQGKNAYGWLKFESGVHRLVRISPFDSNARRHTSFASVWVYPVVDDTIKIEINPADCRIDTYRASGAGGQHVNKTDSAIRITHIPTGIVVQSQTQRSQFQNKDEAFNMLRARLYQLELEKQQQEKNATAEAKGDNGWGNQIRSYVLQPYQMVKDLRTNYETSDTEGVLGGDIDEFLKAALSQLNK